MHCIGSEPADVPALQPVKIRGRGELALLDSPATDRRRWTMEVAQACQPIRPLRPEPSSAVGT